MSEPQFLQRLLDVVSLVSLHGELSMRDIGQALDLPKSTTHRLINSLVKTRLLSSHRGIDSEVFAVGELIEQWSKGQLLWRALLVRARPHMELLRDQTGETVGLHILYSERRVLLAQAVSAHSHRWVYNNTMVPMPLHGGAAAKMLLAMLPDHEMERLAARDYRTNGQDQDSYEAFLRGLLEIRQAGYSLSSDEVNTGIASIAVPITHDTRQEYPPAVLSIAAPAIRLTEDTRKKYIPLLQQSAQQVLHACQEYARKGSLVKKLSPSGSATLAVSE